jgi:hypothetical protein
MRELAKSMLGYSWAVSMFGVQQVTNLLMPGNGKPMAKATDAFNQVTAATLDQLGDTMRATFRAGDQLQRGIVDMMLGGFMMGPCNPERWMGGSNDPGRPQNTAGVGHGGSPSAGTAATGPTWSWGPPRRGDAQAPSRPQAQQACSSSSASNVSNSSQETGWGPMP